MNLRSIRNRSYKKKGGPRNWGNRCSTYAGGCIVCAAYKLFDEHDRFPTFDEAYGKSEEENEGAWQEHETWLKTEEGQSWERNVTRRSVRRLARKAKLTAAMTRRKTKRLNRVTQRS